MDAYLLPKLRQGTAAAAPAAEKEPIAPEAAEEDPTP
jgi:hypothetical protein